MLESFHNEFIAILGFTGVQTHACGLNTVTLRWEGAAATDNNAC